MKILFVERGESEEPMGIMYLIAALRQAGHECDYFSVVWDKRDVVRYVGATQPDIIAYSACTGMHKFYLDLNARLKEQHRFLSLFGGFHPTFCPEMIHKEGVDVLCRGEGEQAVVDLADRLQRGEDITAIAGLWVRRDGKIHENPMRPRIEDLDSLCVPDRELVYRYRALRDNGMKCFMIARGCPYRCSYCFNDGLNRLYGDRGKGFRLRSVDSVVRELADVKATYGVRYFKSYDDTFTLDKAWLEEFAARYGTEVGVPFRCNARVNLLDEEVVGLLKKAGCYLVAIGVETGSVELRNSVLNRNLSDAQIIRACALLKSAGIGIVSENMIGFPGDTLDTAFQTMELNGKLGVDYPNCFLFQPFPSAALSGSAAAQGYFDGDFDRIDERGMFNSTILALEQKRELENLQRLFAVGVRFPAFRRAIRALIRLPLKPLYTIPYLLYGGYKGFRLRAFEPSCRIVMERI